MTVLLPPNTSLHAHNTHHHPFAQKVLVRINPENKNWAYKQNRKESQKHEGTLSQLSTEMRPNGPGPAASLSLKVHPLTFVHEMYFASCLVLPECCSAAGTLLRVFGDSNNIILTSMLQHWQQISLHYAICHAPDTDLDGP